MSPDILATLKILSRFGGLFEDKHKEIKKLQLKDNLKHNVYKYTGALVVTLAMLLHLINCRFIIIFGRRAQIRGALKLRKSK